MREMYQVGNKNTKKTTHLLYLQKFQSFVLDRTIQFWKISLKCLVEILNNSGLLWSTNDLNNFVVTIVAFSKMLNNFSLTVKIFSFIMQHQFSDYQNSLKTERKKSEKNIKLFHFIIILSPDDQKTLFLPHQSRF